MDGRELVARSSFPLSRGRSAFGPAWPLRKAGGRPKGTARGAVCGPHPAARKLPLAAPPRPAHARRGPEVTGSPGQRACLHASGLRAAGGGGTGGRSRCEGGAPTCPCLPRSSQPSLVQGAPAPAPPRPRHPCILAQSRILPTRRPPRPQRGEPQCAGAVTKAAVSSEHLKSAARAHWRPGPGEGGRAASAPAPPPPRSLPAPHWSGGGGAPSFPRALSPPRVSFRCHRRRCRSAEPAARA